MKIDVLHEHESIWDDTLPHSGVENGLYVAISGNTAAGKSSLIKAIQDLSVTDIDILPVSERSLHHPYLRLMFSCPEDFSFPIQVNFMLQRHLVLLRHLGLGHNVVIERSHFDDELFVREHMKCGGIDEDEWSCYCMMSDTLKKRIRVPDVLVLLNPPPEVSLERLTLSEQTKQRPVEFPSEEVKREWVFRWHAAYLELHDAFRRWAQPGGPLSGSSLVELDYRLPTAQAAEQVYSAMQKQLKIS